MVLTGFRSYQVWESEQVAVILDTTICKEFEAKVKKKKQLYGPAWKAIAQYVIGMIPRA